MIGYLLLVAAVQSRDPDANDERLITLICARTDGTWAQVARSWKPEPNAWVITVEPNGKNAAPIEAWLEGADLHVNVAHAQTELWGMTERKLELVDCLVEAVVAGRVQAGRQRVRAHTRQGVRDIGRIGLPMPWPWRRVRSFQPHPRPT